MNPANNSLSKQLYSMSRAKRFQEVQNSSMYCPLNISKQHQMHFSLSSCDQIYNLPEVRSKVATSLGVGNRVEFSKLTTRTPAPNAYYRPSIFDSKKGYSFCLNRAVILLLQFLEFVLYSLHFLMLILFI